MKTLAIMQSENYPTLLVENIMQIELKKDTPEAIDEKENTTKIIQEYLNQFANTNGKCPCCNRDLGGILGTFRWGIVHGEGECGDCGYPVRGHHVIKNEEGETFLTFQNYMMPYHPNGLSEGSTMAL